jgi:hypothetical protein
MTGELFPLIVAHCFLLRCPHTERGLDPVAVHDAMEAHYAARHQQVIDAATGPVRVPVITGAWWEMP